MKKRNLKELVDLMKENNDDCLWFLGFCLLDGSRLWFGASSQKFYLEYRDHSLVPDNFVIAFRLNYMINFDGLKEQLKKRNNDEKLRKRIKFEPGISLIQMIVEDDQFMLRFGGYFETLDFRLWYSVRNENVYIETPVGTYKGKESKYSCEKFMKTLKEVINNEK